LRTLLSLFNIKNDKNRSVKHAVMLVAIVLTLGLFSQVVASYIFTAILDFFPDAAEKYMSDMSSILQPEPGILIYVCIVAPVIEEFVFRGMCLGLLTKVAGFHIANILQALVFGLYHGNLIQGIYAFILGICIGYIFYFLGSIGYTMIFHIGINVAGMLLDYIVPEDSSLIFKSLAALISLLGMLLCVKLISLILKKEKV